MQVDKNCNATGATQNNQQIVVLGANAKHGSDADPKHKDLQQKQQQEHPKSAAPGTGNETGNGTPKAMTTAAAVTSSAAAATPAHPAQVQTVTIAESGEFHARTMHTRVHILAIFVRFSN